MASKHEHEQNLRRLQASLQSVPSALLLIDSAGIIVTANDAAKDIFGYAPDELDGSHLEVLLPVDVRQNHPNVQRAYTKTPYPRTLDEVPDLKGLKKSGELVPLSIGLRPHEVDDEHYVIASFVDMTANLAEQEKTRLALDSAASAMIMVDRDTRITLVNRKACEMFRYKRDELLGEKIEMLIPKEIRRAHVVYRSSFHSNPAQRDMAGGLELNGARSDGTLFPVEVALTPINDHGETMTMATVIDVTAQKLAEQSINEQNIDLLRLNDELARFAYSASHDLKAPLASLDGLLSCIEEDAKDEDLPAVLANVGRTRDLTQRLAKLIEGILGLAKAERIDEAEEEIDLEALIADIQIMLQSTLQDNNIELSLERAGESTIVSQSERLRGILENLIGNAAKFADKKKPNSFVKVSVYRVNCQLVVAVADNGIGIPPEDQANVFKMFSRFTNHSRKGSGLGLSLVKQHVTHLGAEISFTSSPAGTRFEIVFPNIEQVANGASAKVPAAAGGNS